jgi:hypothetical protein
MKKADERWDKMQMSIDMLFAKLGSQEEVQTQMAAQLNLTAQALNQSSKDHMALMQQMTATSELVARLAVEHAQPEVRGGGVADQPGDPHVQQNRQFRDIGHLSFAEQLAIMGSGNLHREANIFHNATMTNMINPVGNRYNDITNIYLVRTQKASLEDVVAHQCLPDENLFHSISGLSYNDSRIYNEDPRFPYSRMHKI